MNNNNLPFNIILFIQDYTATYHKDLCRIYKKDDYIALLREILLREYHESMIKYNTIDLQDNFVDNLFKLFVNQMRNDIFYINNYYNYNNYNNINFDYIIDTENHSILYNNNIYYIYELSKKNPNFVPFNNNTYKLLIKKSMVNKINLVYYILNYIYQLDPNNYNNLNILFVCKNELYYEEYKNIFIIPDNYIKSFDENKIYLFNTRHLRKNNKVLLFKINNMNLTHARDIDNFILNNVNKENTFLYRLNKLYKGYDDLLICYIYNINKNKNKNFIITGDYKMYADYNYYIKYVNFFVFIDRINNIYYKINNINYNNSKFINFNHLSDNIKIEFRKKEEETILDSNTDFKYLFKINDNYIYNHYEFTYLLFNYINNDINDIYKDLYDNSFCSIKIEDLKKNIRFFKKYLKYKKKYFLLKNKL
jgi:hypothetical protein